MRVQAETVLDEGAYPGTSHRMETVKCCCVWAAKLEEVCVSWSVRGLLSPYLERRSATDAFQLKKRCGVFNQQLLNPVAQEAGCEDHHFEQPQSWPPNNTTDSGSKRCICEI